MQSNEVGQLQAATYHPPLNWASMLEQSWSSLPTITQKGVKKKKKNTASRHI